MVLVRVPAARSRLWVIAASTVQAALAGNQPEGWCAQGPSMRSDQTVSQTAWSRWVMSAWVTGSVLLVKKGWQRQTGNSGSWVLASSTRRTTSHPMISYGVSANAVYSTSDTCASEISSPVSGSVTAPGYCTGTNASCGMLAIAALTAGLRATAKEKRAPALTTAAMIFPPQKAESPPTRMLSGWAPASTAVLIASVIMLVAPLDEPARPARSRTPASTGAAVSVLMVTASGDIPRRRMLFPAIFVWPNDAPCLALPYTGRSSESMSM